MREVQADVRELYRGDSNGRAQCPPRTPLPAADGTVTLLEWRDLPQLQGADLNAPIRVSLVRGLLSRCAVVNQFDVENSPRYAKGTRGGGTWCKPTGVRCADGDGCRHSVPARR